MMLLAKFIGALTAMFCQSLTFSYAGQFLQNKVSDYSKLKYVGILKELFLFITFSLIFLKGELIPHAIYDCPWYNIDYEEAKTLVIILKKSAYPLELIGGKFYRLSSQSFLMVRAINLLKFIFLSKRFDLLVFPVFSFFRL